MFAIHEAGNQRKAIVCFWVGTSGWTPRCTNANESTPNGHNTCKTGLLLHTNKSPRNFHGSSFAIHSVRWLCPVCNQLASHRNRSPGES